MENHKQTGKKNKTSKTTQRNVWLWSGSARVSSGNDKREEAAVISIGKSVLKGKVFFTFVNHVYIFKPVVCVCGCTCLCVCRCVCVGFHLFIISIWHRFCCLQLNCTCVDLNISLIRFLFFFSFSDFSCCCKWTEVRFSFKAAWGESAVTLHDFRPSAHFRRKLEETFL